MLGIHWCIVNNWEDCSVVMFTKKDLCQYAEMQHLHASALAAVTSIAGTTPQVCPVDSIVNTHPARQLVDEITLEISGS